jgi:ribosomal protein S18 acetylase RimI-like enzyme
VRRQAEAEDFSFAAHGVLLGGLTSAHVPVIERLLHETGVFRPDEVDVALEVLESYLDDPDRDYSAVGAFTRAGELVGYALYGPTPCTLGTFDLYWIAVSPSSQNAGVGRALLQEVERRLVLADARLLIIETSSQPMYEPTRRFYERHGYDVVARIPDYYTDGDDRMIFVRRLLKHSRG